MRRDSTLDLPPTILVIVGVSGDLAKRKLLPALHTIAVAGELPEQLKIVGITRQNLSTDDILSATFRNSSQKALLEPWLDMYRMDLTAPDDYKKLKQYLKSIAKEWSQPAQVLFYLSVPPEVSRPIIKLLGKSGLANKRSKLLLEKPFGTDRTSAEEMITEIDATFSEDQVYRIDHYLAKEMAQNIIILRSSNSLFRHIWNNQAIEHIEIIASEAIGIENRAIFYEQTGALRDLVQSHLMQLLALTLMELPKDGFSNEVPDKRQAALDAVQLTPAASHAITRAQYEGYRNEVHNPHSYVETFVSLTLESDDPNWQGVPITLTTGKALDEKTTEIRIFFRQTHASEANRLTLRINPHEGIEVDLWAKKPGYQRDLRPVCMQFNYAADRKLPEAYEQVLLDAIRSDKSLFASSGEVLATWRILEPVQQQWNHSNDDLKFYQPGSSIDSIIMTE